MWLSGYVIDVIGKGMWLAAATFGYAAVDVWLPRMPMWLPVWLAVWLGVWLPSSVAGWLGGWMARRLAWLAPCGWLDGWLLS